MTQHERRLASLGPVYRNYGPDGREIHYNFEGDVVPDWLRSAIRLACIAGAVFLLIAHFA